jgi:hypothetical protein
MWPISPTATIFLHAHLQVVHYNCVKFHKNPISCLGGVVLTRYMPTFFLWKYKLNYLPFQILDSDHISSCTSCRCAWRNMVAVENLKGEIIQLIFSRKGGGGMYLVSATPPKRLFGFLCNFTQLYTTCRCAWRNTLLSKI